MTRICLILMFLFGMSPLFAQTLSSTQGPLQIRKMVDGLDVPWSFGFLPDGGLLITERGGDLSYFRDGTRHRVSGGPRVQATGQGGLLDVLIPRDFAVSRQVYVTFSIRQPGGSGTALARGILSADNRRLQDLRILFEAAPHSRGGRHFGARLVEAGDGSLYMTLGERGDAQTAQDLSLHQGSILRLTREGKPHPQNPFLQERNAQPEIWSFGHRNPQGMAIDANGALWAVEHGAKGGDEVNRIRRGANYGWPVIAYGRHYNGAKIGEGTDRPGMEQPAFYWDPSIAPSGMMIYSGKLWPQWRGHVFVGSLKFDYIARLSGNPLQEREALKANETGRVRDLREAPDGSIWFASETEGALFRIAP